MILNWIFFSLFGENFNCLCRIVKCKIIKLYYNLEIYLFCKLFDFYIFFLIKNFSYKNFIEPVFGQCWICNVWRNMTFVGHQCTHSAVFHMIPKFWCEKNVFLIKFFNYLFIFLEYLVQKLIFNIIRANELLVIIN